MYPGRPRCWVGCKGGLTGNISSLQRDPPEEMGCRDPLGPERLPASYRDGDSGSGQVCRIFGAIYANERISNRADGCGRRRRQGHCPAPIPAPG